MTNGVTVTTHYPKSDPEMQGEYSDVTIDVYMNNQHYRLEYGDAYHDKGWERAMGVVDGLKLFNTRLPVLKIRVADREDE